MIYGKVIEDNSLGHDKFTEEFNNEFATVESNASTALSKATTSENYINNTLPGKLESLQNQIDDNVESWFEHADPTLTNAPAKDWITKGEEEKHLNDTYTNLETGHCWRWTKDGTTYKWTAIADTATVKALALAGEAKTAAAAAQTTANAAKTTADAAVPKTTKINGKALSGNITLTPDDIGAAASGDLSGYVPTSRTINGKPLSENISLASGDVGAVPTARKVNGKPLSADVTLIASDVDAVPTSRTVNSKPLNGDIALDASDVGAVPTSRTINGKSLTGNITLSATDVGASTPAELTSAVNELKDLIQVADKEQHAVTAAGVVTLATTKLKSVTSVAYGGAIMPESEYTVSGNIITITTNEFEVEEGDIVTVIFNRGL